MTSLKKRLDNVLGELTIIRHRLDTSIGCPPCCATFYTDGKISCDTVGPLPEEEFLQKCNECLTKIKETLAHFNLDEIEKLTKAAKNEPLFFLDIFETFCYSQNWFVLNQIKE